jgi:hypothetical protein
MDKKHRIVTMRDVKPEPVEWLWKPYLPAGKISIIQGDPGSGKTTMALAIAAAVTTGKGLPGGYCEFPADVIVQNAEDGLTDTIIPRLIQCGADEGMVHFIDEDEQSLTLSDERIERSIIEKSAKLFILDPIQAYLGNANMNSANGIRPLMKRLGDVAARTGCAVLLVGHMNKSGGKSQYRSLGSVDIYAAARSVLTVGKFGMDDDIRAAVHNKSNLSAPGASQAFGFDPVSGFCWLGDCDATVDEVMNGKSKPESQFSKARRLIETALANGPVLSVDMEQAAEEQGISPKTMNRAKSALGVISAKHGSQWYWEIPIVVEYTDVSQDGQHGQGFQDGRENDGQDSSLTNMTSLTIFNGTEV